MVSSVRPTQVYLLLLLFSMFAGELPLSIIKMKTQGVSVVLSGNIGFTLPANMNELGDIQELDLNNCSLTGF